jgi:hypothetical protein
VQLRVFRSALQAPTKQNIRKEGSVKGVHPGACPTERRSQHKSEVTEFRAMSEKSSQGETQHRPRRGKSWQLLCCPTVGSRVSLFVRLVGAVQRACSHGTHAHDDQVEGATLSRIISGSKGDKHRGRTNYQQQAES